MKNFTITLSILLVMSTLTRAQWSSDPSENTAISIVAGEQAIPKVSTSPDGTTYISWFSNESGNYNVRLQKFDLYGNAQWADEGLLISDNPSMSWLTDWDMTVDQDNYAIITFQDIRNGDNDAFAYRISPDGEFIWGEDGIELSSGPAFDAAPKVCVTASGNAVFAWQADEEVLLQKISPEGEKLWGDDGITLSGSVTFSWPQLLPVGEDDVILKYFEDSGVVWAPTRHVFAQRYDADGNTVWAEKATISDAGGISAWTQVFPIINDGSDGFYIAWHDDRDNDMNASVFVQHISVDGEVLLAEDGTEASTQANRENFYPFLALPLGSDDIFVYWNEMDADQNNRGIYGQKISIEGERQWTDNGKAFIEISSTNVYPFGAGTGGAGMVVFYEKYSNVLDAGISAMCIDSDGEFVWSGQMIEMCSVESEKVHSVTSHYVMGQWIAAWEDDRNGNKDIYAQNIWFDGTLGPMVEGEVEVHPDTLFFEENPQTLQVHILNNTFDPYVITEINQEGNTTWAWMVMDMPDLPYSIEAGDSLVLDVLLNVVSADQVYGYVYDLLKIISESDEHEVVISINEDLLSGTRDHIRESESLQVYPNPASGMVHFSFGEGTVPGDKLLILNQSGQIVMEWPLTRRDRITWDCRNAENEPLPAGVYIYRLNSQKGCQSGKITLVR